MYGLECAIVPGCIQGDYWDDSVCSLTAAAIAYLVNAFIQLNHVGEAVALTIRAGGPLPWVMAFTRWGLGIPPRTILELAVTKSLNSVP